MYESILGSILNRTVDIFARKWIFYTKSARHLVDFYSPSYKNSSLITQPSINLWFNIFSQEVYLRFYSKSILWSISYRTVDIFARKWIFYTKSAHHLVDFYRPSYENSPSKIENATLNKFIILYFLQNQNILNRTRDIYESIFGSNYELLNCDEILINSVNLFIKLIFWGKKI